jgi:hemerythrin-like domain-containing protein
MTSKTSKILIEEHENILKVVEALKVGCDLIEKDKKVDKDFFEKVIDFIKNYADKFHHAKEEDILFKEFSRAAEKGEAHCNPVEQMLHEHDIGRSFVKGMKQALKENDKEKLVKNAEGYAGLICEHIFKENKILYPMADEVLSKEVQKKMLDEFEEIGKKKIVEKKKYLGFVAGLDK